MQFTPGKSEEAYTLDAPVENCGFTLKIYDDEVAGSDLAVLVNISADVTVAVRSTIGLPTFRGT